MRIDVKQTNAEGKNEFEILYDGIKKFDASLPWLKIDGVFDLDKTRNIKVKDNDGNIVYETSYNYIENKIEEFIPLKYLLTGSQKYNQIVVKDNNSHVLSSIYYEMTEIAKGFIVIEKDSKYYVGYHVSDGYIVHICIYDGDKQIAELLKPQVVIDEKDEYNIFLKDEYSFLADFLMIMALYVDNNGYSSSYLKVKSQKITYSKTYSKVNKYYDSNWVRNNFDSLEYFNELDKKINVTKQNIKSGSLKIWKIVGIGFGIVLLLFLIILLIIVL